MENFPFIHLYGTPYERGLRHGTVLKERIEKTIEFYSRIFGQPEEVIFSKALNYKDIIAKADPNLIIEIEAIAEGANLPVEWIYALNARSEIITTFVSECTALYSKESHLLAQNWDWAEELEELAVVMQIDFKDGHSILMMTEPGIIGKIGINSSGLGVTLNFLHAPGKLDGLPIHIMLRLLLQQRSFANGLSIARKFSKGKGGNIIFASTTGEYVNLEFANSEIFELNDPSIFIHTNHYLADDSYNRKKELLASSLNRYARSNELISGKAVLDRSMVETLLFDQNNTELPICRPYVLDEEIGNVGTVCSIIMDLQQLSIDITLGNPFNNRFETFVFQ